MTSRNTPVRRSKASNTATPRKRMLSVQQVAAELGVQDAVVRNMIATGELRAVRVGRLIRIDPADLDAALSPVVPDAATPAGRRSVKAR